MTWIWVNAVVAVVSVGLAIGPIIVAILLDAEQSRFERDVTRDIALLATGPALAALATSTNARGWWPTRGRQAWALCSRRRPRSWAAHGGGATRTTSGNIEQGIRLGNSAAQLRGCERLRHVAGTQLPSAPDLPGRRDLPKGTRVSGWWQAERVRALLGANNQLRRMPAEALEPPRGSLN